MSLDSKTKLAETLPDSMVYLTKIVKRWSTRSVNTGRLFHCFHFRCVGSIVSLLFVLMENPVNNMASDLGLQCLPNLQVRME